jgi:hypothetical protein
LDSALDVESIVTGRPRLNGWQRIGIILSVVWMIGAYLHVYDDRVENFTAMNVAHETACMDQHRANGETFDQYFPICDAIGKTNGGLDRAMAAFHDARMEALVIAIGGALLGWVVAYLVVFLFRWTKHGFDGVKS